MATFFDLTGFYGTEAAADLNTDQKEPAKTPCAPPSCTSEQRREVWLKLLESDGCLGSWNKETGEWISLL